MRFFLPCVVAITAATLNARAQNFAPALTAATPPAFSGLAGDSATFASGLQLHRTNHSDPSWGKFASGAGSLLFVSAGTLLPLVEDGKDGQQHAIRTADALAVSTLLAEGLKIAVHKKRPDGSDYQSFPSGHATAAFTVAAIQAHSHPKQAIFWYAGATTIAASRVKLHRHYTVDVLAGAALGYATARWELGQNRGLLLRPFIRPLS